MKKTQRASIARWIPFLLLVTLASLAFFLYRWTFLTWPNLKLDEVIYHMKAPVEGTSADLVLGAFISILGPTALVLIAALACSFWLSSRKAAILVWFHRTVALLAAALLIGTAYTAYQRLELGAYLGGNADEDFIQDHYVDPAERSIVFPENKKNLIYIYLESTETTMADKSSGGAFDANVIPELTELALANEDFSGSSSTLNGAHVLSGSSWTMGAMFSHTSGLPLKISIDGNAMNTQDQFFPGLVTMGDILENEGYNQALLIGSEGEFGGRSLYFQEHGNYSIIDYNHAIIKQRIPPDYYVWWGFEDQKLFDYAKEEVTALAAQDQPFNLTLLTVDTHFEDGYVCDSCPTTHDDQYSNVFACSSKQAADFVAWVQTQDFAQDTVIVLAGDHLTMDKDYCADIDADYSRKTFVSFINAQKEPETDQRREYSTLDLFPTTLSALGAEIEGSQLGLGVDLFSAQPTMVERYGKQAFNQSIARPSALMKELSQITLSADVVPELRFDPAANKVTLSVYNLESIAEPIKAVEAVITADSEEQIIPLTLQPDKSYAASATLTLSSPDFCAVRIFASTKNGNRYQIGKMDGNLCLMGVSSVENYLEQLTQLEDHTILLAVKDEAANSLSDAAAAYLRSLGLTEDLQNAYRHSYYAVIGPDECQEELSADPVGTSGTLPDGAPYIISSAGFLTGSASAKIFINATNYAVNSRGLNFVVYDNASSRVVDSSAFDTYMDTTRADLSITASRIGQYELRLSNVNCYPVPDFCKVYLWRAKQPSRVLEVTLEPAGSGVYTADLSALRHITEDWQITVYAMAEGANPLRLNATTTVER